MIETNIFWNESCSRQEIRRLGSSNTPPPQKYLQVTKEEQVLLNFDELIAVWYFILTLWYGCFRLRDWKFANLSRSDRVDSIAKYEFSAIHWLIVCISIMGLANFLFSVSLLKVMDHRSSIGSSVLKLSYVNMFLACLRHPCTLSLGVLAPKVAAAESIKSTTIYLAAPLCAQFVLRLAESLVVLFCDGSHGKSGTVKLGDFFEYILDGVFLIWMVISLYKITMEISRNEYFGHGGGDVFGVTQWQAWWKSRNLLFLWICYSIFVSVSTALVVIGVVTFFGGSVFGNQRFVYNDYKASTLNDLLLLTGIAILFKPKPMSYFETSENHSDGEQGSEINYQLLGIETNEEETQVEGDNPSEINFEMTTAAFITYDSTALRNVQELSFKYASG